MLDAVEVVNATPGKGTVLKQHLEPDTDHYGINLEIFR